MEENSKVSGKYVDCLNEIVEITICLPTKVERRGTTTTEKLSQVCRKLMRQVILRDDNSLFDIAVAHSRVLRDALKLSKSRTTHLQEQMTVETTHHMLSEHEETYSVKTYLQKQLQDQLELHLSWYNDELKILAGAPRGLFLTLSLSENYSCLFYRILCT